MVSGQEQERGFFPADFGISPKMQPDDLIKLELDKSRDRKKVTSALVTNVVELTPEIEWEIRLGDVQFPNKLYPDKPFRGEDAFRHEIAAHMAVVAISHGWGLGAPEVVVLSAAYTRNKLGERLRFLEDKIQAIHTGKRNFGETEVDGIVLRTAEENTDAALRREGMQRNSIANDVAILTKRLTTFSQERLLGGEEQAKQLEALLVVEKPQKNIRRRK